MFNQTGKVMRRPYFHYSLLTGDCLDSLTQLEDNSVHCCVTNPPYFGLRDYGVEGQIGLEPTPDEFVQALVEVFREVRRVLRDDGTLWLNLGDSYSKGKQLLGVPWQVAFALQADGWVLRQDIIWHKPNPMPSAVTDRCVTAHEYIFLLAKRSAYSFDHAVIKEPAKYGEHHAKYQGTYARHKLDAMRKSGAPNGSQYQAGLSGRQKDPMTRNKRGVWSIPVNSFKGAHFATFPPALIEPCILAGCPPHGTVLDPFGGSGTTAGVALLHDRNAILCELNPEYGELVEGRVSSISGLHGKRYPGINPAEYSEMMLELIG